MKRTIFAILAVAAICAAQSSDTPHARELPFSLATLSNDFQRQTGIADNQLKAMGTVADVNRAKLQELRDEVGKKETELQEILNAGTVDLAAAEKAVDAVMEARNHLAKTQTMMIINMRLILTADQWHKMQELQARNSSPQPAAGAQPMSRTEANEASALATVRVINTAEYTFRATWNKGFTDGLNRMGTPPNGIPISENYGDLVDKILSGNTLPDGTNFSFTKNGYRFLYTPGPGAFGVIQQYTMTGQPLEYGVTGTKSFYTDEKAVIHLTLDNRAAGPNDPPLGGGTVRAAPAATRKPDNQDNQQE